MHCVMDLSLLLTHIQLCELYESSKYGAAQCFPLLYGCQGSLYGTTSAPHCYPHIIWASSLYTISGHYYARAFVEGSLSSTYYPTTLAGTVRCVLDLTIHIVHTAL